MKKTFWVSLLTFGIMFSFFCSFSWEKKFWDLSWLKPLVEQFNKHFEVHQGERLYVMCNQPLYKPGETVWFSIFLANESDLTSQTPSDILNVKITSPKGDILQEYKLVAKEGVAYGDFTITPDLPGGIYTIEAFTNWQQNDPSFQPFKKTFQVQKAVLPRLLLSLNFPKRGYGPGETVIADFVAKTLNNKPLANQKINAQLKLQGNLVNTFSFQTNEQGKVQIQFPLPQQLQSPDATLNVTIPFEGQTEAIARSIPINLNFVNLAFYPESGDLVQDLPTVVAFQALNTYGKGTDVQGKIIDSKGNTITTFQSFHLGKGSFNFTPKANETYHAVVTSPANITQTYQLPPIQEKGFIFNVTQQTPQSLTLNIKHNTNKRTAVLAQMRGKIYFAQELPSAQQQTVTIPTDKIPQGVLHITLFDEDQVERAERLVFINPHKKMQIKVVPDKQKYEPRDKVTLQILTTDEMGLGVPANLALAVTDENILKLADDKQPHLLAELLLQQDVKGTIEEPNFYFDPQQPNATKALDLLLMTQGWRRFTWKEIRQVLPIQNFAEKAIFAGTVLTYDAKPAKGAKVTLSIGNQNYSQNTDANGHFEFKGIPFDADYGYITALLNNYSNSIYVEAYHNNLQLYLYPSTKSTVRYKKNARPNEGVPMMAGAVDGEVEEDAADEEMDMAVNHQLAVRDKDNAPNVETKNAPKKEVPNQPIEEPNRHEGQLLDDELVFAEKKKDMHADVPMKRNRYYRARQFPNVKYASKETDIRDDFRSCLYWNPHLQTDNKGKASVTFFTNDQITTFAVTVEGISTKGLAGTHIHSFASQKPFAMSTKIPNIVSMGDLVKIPIALQNNTSQTLNGALEIITPKSWKLRSSLSPISIQPQQTLSQFIEFEILNLREDSSLTIIFKNANGQKLDAFKQPIQTYAKGFPLAATLSGSKNKEDFILKIMNPIDGTLQLTFEANPSPVAEALSGLENLIRVPSGCFEQTSYSNYPNLVVMNYAKEYPELFAKVQAKIGNNLEVGYKRLTSYETKQNGYEWFGSTPAHEALTAYGLMQFKDMQQVYANVDATMINRTAQWLFSRRDGKGGFLRDPKALDSFGRAAEDITNAYITYALTEAGYADKIQKEIENTYQLTKKSNDPYLYALCLNIFAATKDKRYSEIEQWLMKNKDKNELWTGTRHSITYSQGQALTVETTALVGLALLKQNNLNFAMLSNIASKLITYKNDWGQFASTQGTILTLKLLAQLAQKTKAPRENGTLNIYINGKKVFSKPIQTTDVGPIKANLPTEALKTTGDNNIRVEYEGMKEGIPFTLYCRYSVLQPKSNPECKLRIQTQLQQKDAKMGDAVRLNVSLKNTTVDGLPMSMAIVGIPGGLTPQPQQLKELQEKNVFDFYEIKDQYIAFYYRALPPNAEKTIPLDLKADIPGTYDTPASFCYLYYTNEHKHWHSAGSITIKP